jgi:hypothetical protein
MNDRMAAALSTLSPRARLLAGGAAFGAAFTALFRGAPAGAAPAAPAPAATTPVAFDVCCDGRTYRLANGLGGEPGRGAGYIVNGKLFPAGTFAKGPTNPDSPGSVGTWVCRGHFYYGLDEIMRGAAPHVASTQYYILDDGSMLVSDGLEGGAWFLRAVTGGTGRYLGTRGLCTEEQVGTNTTMIQLAQGVAVPAPNIAFNFDLQ